MIPRGRLDLGWSDLGFALARGTLESMVRTLSPRRGEARRAHLVAKVEEAWRTFPESTRSGEAVVVLSVRSGLDLLLQALSLPPGTPILMSGVTIADMVRVARAHRLRVLPVDLDMDTLSLDPAALEAAWEPGTRILVVAHLFGSRMPLGPVVGWARERGVLVVEDGAQAWTGDGYAGAPGVDVSLFSFGMIKTRTALGGALAGVRDPELAGEIRRLRDALPVQEERSFLGRAAHCFLLQLLLLPPLYSLFALGCRVRGRCHDQVIGSSVRGFPGPDLLGALRHQPSAALLALLLRRLREGPAQDRIRARARSAEAVLSQVSHLPRPGRKAHFHSHWVVPVEVADPHGAGRRLREAGIDATCGASSLGAIDPTDGGSAPGRAGSVMERILYLPAGAGGRAWAWPELGSLEPPPPERRDTCAP
jgi:perosamine synthetase